MAIYNHYHVVIIKYYVLHIVVILYTFISLVVQWVC
jgi:hypothetical protein